MTRIFSLLKYKININHSNEIQANNSLSTKPNEHNITNQTASKLAISRWLLSPQFVKRTDEKLQNY